MRGIFGWDLLPGCSIPVVKMDKSHWTETLFDSPGITVEYKPTFVLAVDSHLTEIPCVSANEVTSTQMKKYGVSLAREMCNSMAVGQWDAFVTECRKLDDR